MRKFFSYFNSLTGEREISNSTRFNMFFNQVRTQGDQKIMPEIYSAIASLNQDITDCNYLLSEISALPKPLPDIDFIQKENDFLWTGLQNTHISLFNEPLELLPPSLKLENKIYNKILRYLKSTYTNFSSHILILQKKINIGQLSRLLSLMTSSASAILSRLDEMLVLC